MSKTITKVIRVDNNTKKLMCDFYQDMLRPKTPPYAIFQADTGDTIVTLYESGKAMFQGVSADIEAGLWTTIEKDKDNIEYFIDIDNDKKKKDEENSEIATTQTENKTRQNYYASSALYTLCISSLPYIFSYVETVSDAASIERP